MSIRSRPPVPKEEHPTHPSTLSRLHRVLAAGLTINATITTNTTNPTSVKRQTREETDVDGNVLMVQDAENARDTPPKRSKPLPPECYSTLPQWMQFTIILGSNDFNPCERIDKYVRMEPEFAEKCENDENFWYWLCTLTKFDSNAAITSEWHQKEAKKQSRWDTWKGWFEYCCPLRLTNDTLQWKLDEWQENLDWDAVVPYGPISTWDTSHVTDMRDLFQNYPDFNDDIGKWDVSRVQQMAHMFAGAEDFNQDISRWDVSWVLNMKGMFQGAASFNQDIGRWNVHQVTDMSHMFDGAKSFNQDIGSWNVSQVEQAYSMFAEATSFNQDLRGWNLCNLEFVPGVRESMFEDATSFDRRYRPITLVEGC